MKITVNDKGILELDIRDLLQEIPDDEAQTLIEAMAWDTRMWQSLKDAIKNEHGAYSYNEKLLELRLAFLTEWDDSFNNPYTRVAGVISALLTEVNRQRESARAADKAFWTIYHQFVDIARQRGITLQTPEHAPMQFFNKAAEEIAKQYMPERPKEEE